MVDFLHAFYLRLLCVEYLEELESIDKRYKDIQRHKKIKEYKATKGHEASCVSKDCTICGGEYTGGDMFGIHDHRPVLVDNV